MLNFKEYIKLNEKMFDDYEALASKFTKMFKKYSLKKTKSMSAGSVGKVDIFTKEFVVDNESYLLTVRRTPISGEDFTHFYNIKSLIKVSSNENLITKELHVAETANNYIQLETFLKALDSVKSEKEIQSTLKHIKVHVSI